MLSYIYSVVGDFERRHGHMPNLLYISTEHLNRLRDTLEQNGSIDDLASLLGMNIVITRDAVHPRVSWSDTPWVRRSAS
ncbi:MAG: hypothetical protein GXP09_09385 [Gammaproteobacteria bacterium]|nr:hypothetical protein [Gammaproteobacteria bacterium]